MGVSDRNMATLSACCVALGISFGVLIGGALAPPVATEPWLKSYQGLLGALLGIIGVGCGLAVATYNVLRQMRLNIVSREEDRIERTLPGLRVASNFLFGTATILKQAPDGQRDQLFRQLGIDDVYQFNKSLPERFPSCDDATRQLIIEAISEMMTSLKIVGVHHLPREVIAARLMDRAAALDNTIHKFERRLPHFRLEIERYFDG